MEKNKETQDSTTDYDFRRAEEERFQARTLLTLILIVMSVGFLGILWANLLETDNYNVDSVNQQIEILTKTLKTIDYDMTQDQTEESLVPNIEGTDMVKTGGTIVTITNQSATVIYNYEYTIENRWGFVDSDKVFAEVSAHYEDDKLVFIKLDILRDWNK